MVSRALVKPWMILRPDTLAVIDPSVIAARAVVDKCPTESTEAMTRLYSNTCVLNAFFSY